MRLSSIVMDDHLKFFNEDSVGIEVGRSWRWTTEDGRRGRSSILYWSHILFFATREE